MWTPNVQIAQSSFVHTATSASYQWYNCDSDQLISGEVAQTFAPLFDGNYAVIVSQNGCMDTSACQLVQGIGLPDVNEIAFSISPNPNNGYFTLKTNTKQKLTLKVYDSTGRLVDSDEVNSTTFKGYIRGKSGLYFIELHDDKKLVGKTKIVKL